MRVSFVSDIHGNVDGLARAAQRAEQLVVLGDLLDYVDYHDPGAGILGRIFGADRVREFTRLRSIGDLGSLRGYNDSLWAGIADPVALLTEVVSELYLRIVGILPPSSLLTLGNVDVAQVWNRVAGDRMPYLDGEVVTLGGRRLGFVAGGSSLSGGRRNPDPIWQPLVRTAADFTAAIAALGPVDVLCSHVPPNLPGLRYDVIPARMEMYGPGLLEYIDTHQPALAVFGHVHQPLARRIRRGRTECVNVGHFQRFPRSLDIEIDDLDR